MQPQASMFQRVGKTLLEPLQLLPTESNISVLHVVAIVRETHSSCLLEAAGLIIHPSQVSLAASLNLIIC